MHAQYALSNKRSQNKGSRYSKLNEIWENISTYEPKAYLSLNLQTIIDVLDRQSYESNSRYDWQEILVRNCRNIVDAKNKPASLFYFKVVSLLSKGEVTLPNMINLLISERNNLQMDKTAKRITWEDCLITYPVFKTSNPRNVYLFQKITVLICMSFKYDDIQVEPLYKHYAMYCIGHLLRYAFLMTVEHYLSFQINKSKETKFSFNSLMMVKDVLGWYEKVEPNQKQIREIRNLCGNFAFMVRRDEYVMQLKDSPVHETVIKWLMKIDAEDKSQAQANITFNLLASKIGVYYLKKLNPQTTMLSFNFTIQEACQYFVGIFIYLNNPMVDRERSEKQAATCLKIKQNLDMIFHSKRISSLSSFLELFINQTAKFSNNRIQNSLFKIDYNNLNKVTPHETTYYVMCLPYHRLQLHIFKMRKNLGEINSFLKGYYVGVSQMTFCALLLQNQQNINDSNRNQLLDHVKGDLADSLAYETPACSVILFKTLQILSRIIVGPLAEAAYLCISSLLRKISLKKILETSKQSAILFKGLQSVRYQIQLKQIKDRDLIYFCKTLSLFLKSIIECKGAFRWMENLQEGVFILGAMYQELEDDELEDIIEDLRNISSEDNVCSCLIEGLKLGIFQEIKHSSILKGGLKTIVGIIELIESFCHQKQLTEAEKVSFVEFFFNIRCELSMLYQRNKQHFSSNKESYFSAIDSIDLLEVQVLNQTSQRYIDQLIIQSNIDYFPLAVSVALKKLYYLLYQKKANISDSVSANNKNDGFIFNIEEQLDKSTIKIKLMQTLCTKMMQDFLNFKFQALKQEIISGLTLYKVQVDNQGDVLLRQLDDLMYIFYLCGFDKQANYYIRLRLSFVHQICTREIFILEVSRYIFFDFFDEKPTYELKLWVSSQLIYFQSNPYCDLAALLALGAIAPSCSLDSRMHKIIFLLNQDPLLYLERYTDVIMYLYNFVFNNYIVGTINISEEEVLIRPKVIDYHTGRLQKYWTKSLWEEGWVPLRVLTKLVKQVFKKCIEINQLSRIKSPLKLVLMMLIRSGHLADLLLPFQVLLAKKMPLDCLKVVDSLKKLVQINYSHYKQIDKLICHSRRSHSFGLSLNATQLIQKSFQRAGPIGIIMAQIFLNQLAGQLNLNHWDLLIQRSKMPIFRSFLIHEDFNLIQISSQQRQLPQEIECMLKLAQSLTSVMSTNYTRALAIKDYISLFTDQAIDNYAQLTSRQNSKVDLIIATVALTFEDYNFSFKQFCNEIIVQDFLKKQLRQLYELAQTIKDKIKIYNEQEQKNLGNKIMKLSMIEYPMSQIFPLGSYLYNIAWSKRILVTFSRKVDFQDKWEIWQNILKRNEELLKPGQVISSQNSKKRMGLDREMGKMAYNLDLGIMDMRTDELINSSFCSDIARVHSSLLKFLLSDSPSVNQHLPIFLKRNHIELSPDFITRKLQQINDKLRRTNARQNILLLIHYIYQSFPFQLAHSAKNSKGIYRIPSAKYLLDNQHLTINYNLNSCKYLVNTKGDLAMTESRFDKIRENYAEWIGIRGRIPEIGEFKHLFSEDVYLYMGHGSGLQLFDNFVLHMMKVNCLMMVFGCSSAKMIFDASQPQGCSWQLLMNGCPAYLGCLWTVTDLDIDRVTQQIFSAKTNWNLSQLVEQGRAKCAFPYINGSAIVIYGLPVYISRT